MVVWFGYCTHRYGVVVWVLVCLVVFCLYFLGLEVFGEVYILRSWKVVFD